MNEINYLVNLSSTIIQRDCTGMTQSLECFNKLACPQLKMYFVKTGVYLLIANVVVLMLSNLVLKKFYKHIKYFDTMPESERLGWMCQIREWLNDAMMFFIMIVIYLNI